MREDKTSELKPCPFCNMPAASITSKIDGKEYYSCLDVDCPNGSWFTPEEWDNRPIEDALNARIAELEAAQKEALSLLPELERGHYYCDDCWYSCPKAVDGCCDESRGDECDCGADDYNALLAKIIGLLTPEVQDV